MRPIWKGTISFGLVNIPVGLYSATRPASEIRFRLLRGSDHSPIKYKRVAEVDSEEVPWEHIVKGYEFEKGHFVIVTEEDFERVNVDSNQTVDIREFVELDKVDPMFFDKPYFLAPEKGGDKAYALLREALKNSNKAGIAKVVIRTREHLAAVKPLGNALVLELMHFADELADASALKLPEVAVGKKELGMAQMLIDSMSGEWRPENYKDEYREGLMKLIEEKAAAGGKEISGKKPAARPTKVVDLVAVLQQSLKQTQQKSEKAAKASKPKKRKAA